MATPIANVETLHAYWKAALAASSEPDMAFALRVQGTLAVRLADAQRAAKELIDQAGGNPHTRVEVFAARAVLETALLSEPAGATERIFAVAKKLQGIAKAQVDGILATGDRARRPPRQIILDGIYAAGTGGLFSPRDPSGVTSWCRSVHVASGAMVGTVKGDPRGEVRAAALKIIAELAIPEFWVKDFKNQRVFEDLHEQLPTSALPLTTRVVLDGLGKRAEGRIETEIAKLATSELAPLPTFPTGDGTQAPTFPPAPRPWWRDGKTLAAGALGLLVGGRVAMAPARHAPPARRRR